jgi:methylase of polypeptide subunit release factors
MNQKDTPLQTPRWGAQNRDRKAVAIGQTLRYCTDLSLEQALCVDLGCGSGGIAFYLSPHVGTIIGIDPEAWPLWDE